MQSQHIPLCVGGPGKEVDTGREEYIGKEVDIGTEVDISREVDIRRCVISSVVVVPGGLGCTSDAVLENSILCSQKGPN